jgi:hypothetical protein
MANQTTSVSSVDERLLEEVREAGKFTTDEEAINAALREFIKKRKQMEIINLFGHLDPDPDYDYKKARNL